MRRKVVPVCGRNYIFKSCTSQYLFVTPVSSIYFITLLQRKTKFVFLVVDGATINVMLFCSYSTVFSVLVLFFFGADE